MDAANPLLSLILDMIDEGYDRSSWHGPNLKNSLRGVSASEAVWRPRPGAPNIWEIALHCAYWKYVVVRRLQGGKRGSFARKGSDWFERPDRAGVERWRADVTLLDETHAALRTEAARLTGALLADTPGNSSTSNAAILRGIAFHDVYHAGQIQQIRRARRETRAVALLPVN